MAKEQKAKKVYLETPDAKEGKRSYFDGATILQFQFANGEIVSVNPMDFSAEVRTAAMFHGLSQKLGDAYASSKDADEAWEKFEALRERIAGGEWIAEGESAGPRISLVVKAIVAAKAKAGVTTTEAEVAAKYAQLSKEQQKTVLEDPRIKAEYEALRAAAAAARAAKAAEAADAVHGAGFAI